MSTWKRESLLKSTPNCKVFDYCPDGGITDDDNDDDGGSSSRTRCSRCQFRADAANGFMKWTRPIIKNDTESMSSDHWSTDDEMDLWT